MLWHAFSSGRSDFAAVGGIRAQRSDVRVDEPIADGADQRLAELVTADSRRAPDQAAPSPSER